MPFYSFGDLRLAVLVFQYMREANMVDLTWFGTLAALLWVSEVSCPRTRQFRRGALSPYVESMIGYSID